MVEFLWIFEVYNIFWNFLYKNKSSNLITASALRQGDVSGQRGRPGQTWLVGPACQYLIKLIIFS